MILIQAHTRKRRVF